MDYCQSNLLTSVTLMCACMDFDLIVSILPVTHGLLSVKLADFCDTDVCLFRRGLFSRSYTGSRLAAGACLLPGVCWRAWLLPVTGPTTISTVHDFGLTCMGSGG